MKKQMMNQPNGLIGLTALLRAPASIRNQIILPFLGTNSRMVAMLVCYFIKSFEKKDYTFAALFYNSAGNRVSQINVST